MNKTKNCFYCNTKLELELSAFKVISMGGKKGSMVKDFTNLKEKLVETLPTDLSFCPLCSKKERIEAEEILWLSLEEIFTALKEGKVISDNPEIELIFKFLQFLSTQKLNFLNDGEE